eukprot:Awhi_evm1s12977
MKIPSFIITFFLTFAFSTFAGPIEDAINNFLRNQNFQPNQSIDGFCNAVPNYYAEQNNNNNNDNSNNNNYNNNNDNNNNNSNNNDGDSGKDNGGNQNMMEVFFQEFMDDPNDFPQINS